MPRQDQSGDWHPLRRSFLPCFGDISVGVYSVRGSANNGDAETRYMLNESRDSKTGEFRGQPERETALLKQGRSDCLLPTRLAKGHFNITKWPADPDGALNPPQNQMTPRPA